MFEQGAAESLVSWYFFYRYTSVVQSECIWTDLLITAEQKVALLFSEECWLSELFFIVYPKIKIVLYDLMILLKQNEMRQNKKLK